jgi:ribosomal-protein-alanine acetyltransferase
MENEDALLAESVALVSDCLNVEKDAVVLTVSLHACAAGLPEVLRQQALADIALLLRQNGYLVVGEGEPVLDGPPSREPILVPMAEEHLAQVMAIEIEAFPSPWTPLAYVLELRHNPKACYRVLVSSRDEVLGYLGFWLEGDRAFIVRLAVASAARNKGWGRFLVDAAGKLAKEKGADDMLLEVRRSNETAQAFYRALGFKTVATLEAYYVAPLEDASVMHKSLADIEPTGIDRAGTEQVDGNQVGIEQTGKRES